MSALKIQKYSQNAPPPTIPLSNNIQHQSAYQTINSHQISTQYSQNQKMSGKNIGNQLMNTNNFALTSSNNMGIERQQKQQKRLQSEQNRMNERTGNRDQSIFSNHGQVPRVGKRQKQNSHNVNTNMLIQNGDVDISRQSVVLPNDYQTQGVSSQVLSNKNATQPFLQSRQKSAQNPQRKQNEISANNGNSSQQPNDLLKLFGNERNFQLIKQLMDSSQIKSSNQPKSSKNRNKVPNQMSQRVLNIGQQTQQSQIIDDKEIKVEKAILDLNELKTQMFSEKQSQNNMSIKDQFRKTNFSNFQQTSYSTQSAFSNKFGPVKVMDNNTQSSFYQGQNQNNISHISNQTTTSLYQNPPNFLSSNPTVTNNQLPSVTQASFFSNQTSFNFNKAASLTQNIEQMDREQLKERLLVAETLMKKLYNKNKELEDQIQKQSTANQDKENLQSSNSHSKLPSIAQQNSNQNDSSANPPQISDQQNQYVTQNNPNLDLDLIEKLKKREDELVKELEEKQRENDNLKQSSLEQLKKMSENQANNYSYFLEERLAECQLENRRILLKYQEIRNFAYQQIEQHIKQLNKKKNNNIQNNNLTVYKQMIERERKHWQYEIEQKTQQIERSQLTIKEQEESLIEFKGKVKELEEEIETRDTCEAKVQEYVKNLVQKNEELQKKVKELSNSKINI